MKTASLSLRLLRAGADIEGAIRAESGLEEIEADGARLFVAQAPATPPRWFGFVNSFAKGKLRKPQNQSCGAVLFLRVPAGTAGGAERICAASFGTAHHSLDPEAFERSFGLRVVLNSVSRANLRSLDTATLDATTIQRRIQASRNADLQAFGMDLDRDLLRLAAGVPDDAGFGRSLAGKDALTVHKQLEPGELTASCARAIELFASDAYKRDFGFIDHIAPVRDRALVEALDSLVFAELLKVVAEEPSDLHLTLPDVLDPEQSYEIGYFGAGLKPGAKTTYNAVDIEDYVAELRAGDLTSIPDMAALKASHEIRAIIDGEGDRHHHRRVYKCFVYETVHGGQTYVLFDGDWFQVERAFYEMVEADFNDLVATPFVQSTTARTERDFIAELDARDDLLNLDQVKLSPAGSPGANLEPCDFLSRTKQFIHLKDGHGSAPISHLWNQGLVSAEAFVRDAEYRRHLRNAVKKRQKKANKEGFDLLLPTFRNRPAPSEYPVVFGIMRSPYARKGTLGLPFFSKVSLRSVAARIDAMGYPVQVHLIEKQR